MSNTPVQDPPAQELSSGTGQTLPFRPFQTIPDHSSSKRVCFYKSGDYQFSGHRMVINGRTFKTFDALLDALSKKVPLPFGVRTITTPRGTHLVRALEDLHDGGSYVCSDQKRVKPMNLDEVNRRQVPWNATRPLSAVRRRRQGAQVGRRNDVANRPAKITERVSVRTPKRLEVIKNRDPSVKRTIVLQRRTAPTFDALLDYLSQILQFPVLKLFTTDGRRVDGLAALILCSGVVVAAGTEPFRLGNYSFHRGGQMAQVMYMENVEPSILQLRAQNNKSFSSGRGSRNFSLSSERYIVSQIKKSQTESMKDHLHHHSESLETEVNRRQTSLETSPSRRGDNERHASIFPQEDDIEKSFRVNQDGSMTVEMKVHLTIKEEEMLHWTTTLSRTSLSKRTVCASISESDNSSPDSNNIIAKDSSSISENETKEENNPAGEKGISFNDKQECNGYTSNALTTSKNGFKRTPTPGPRHIKRASVESVKTLTESGVQESTLGHYSYTERTADGETTEGYCVLQHSSSSNRPIPKPRKTASAGASNKGSHSSIRSSGVAEVLQIQNNGMEVTETVMHIFESQGCYDNYFANEDYNADGVPVQGSSPAPESKSSNDSSSQSSGNDCDIDSGWHPPRTDPLQRQTDEMLSLSSDPITSPHEIMNNLSSVNEHETTTATNAQMQESLKKVKTPISEKKKKIKPARNQKSSTSTSSSDKKQKEGILSPVNSKNSSADKVISSMGKKNVSLSESAKSIQKSTGAEIHNFKRASKDENIQRSEQALLVNSENVKKTQPKRLNFNKPYAKDNGHNVNVANGRPQMKKNMLDILQPKKSLLPARKASKPKSITENRASSIKKSKESNESFSVPCVNPSPSEIHQYVENWLEKVDPDPVTYTAEDIVDESESRNKVVFQVGGDSEPDERNECQTELDEYYTSSHNAVKPKPSCLTVPGMQHNEQYLRGLCSSMPDVRVDSSHLENRPRSHSEAICPPDNEPSSSTSNLLSARSKIEPVLRQLCSSIQCIREASFSNSTSNLAKYNSLPDFPSQVASVFGSSCKTFLSFLSVMTLRDNLTGSAIQESNQSGSPSEAMLMMESLQKISTTDGVEEQRASLMDLQSTASSQLRDRWKDFQVLRERLESEPLSPKFSETEFALDVFSEAAVSETGVNHPLGIDQLMEELNMPQDIREQISSTIHQDTSFYPVEESTFLENERNQSDTDEDVEKFVEEGDDEIKQSPESSIIKMTTEPEQELDEVGDKSMDVQETEVSHPGGDEHLNGEVNEEKEVEADSEGGNDREDGDKKDDDNEETEREEMENEESVQKVDEIAEKANEMDEETEEEISKEQERGVVRETDEGLVNGDEQNASGDDSAEETDEREGVEELEEDEEMGHKVGEGDEVENEEERETEETPRAEKDEETDQDSGGTDGAVEVADIIEEEGEEDAIDTSDDAEEEDEDGLEVVRGDEKRDTEEVIEEKDKGEEIEEVSEEEDEGDAAEEKDKEDEGDAAEEKDEEDEGDSAEERDEEDEGDSAEEKAEEEDVTEAVSQGNSEEEEDGDGEVMNVEERVISDEEEERVEDDINTDEEELPDELGKTKLEQDSDSEDEIVTAEADGENLIEEASYLQQQNNCEEDAAVGTMASEHDTESPKRFSSEDQCEDDKGNGTDTAKELETDEEGVHQEERSLPHPAEISQELLDFVNLALQFSSLVFTYDTQGNMRIEPDNACVVQTKPIVIPKSRKDSSYGLRSLPSPSTSDLSDYRPESSESGGYKSQDSVDVVTESGEEASDKPFPVCRRSTKSCTGRNSEEGAKSKLSVAGNSGVAQKSQSKSGGSFSSRKSSTKASGEDLSYFSGASSQKTDAKAATHCISFDSEKDCENSETDGVLIDKGRWLLKENHLIRKSPPVSQGMYGDADSTSIDTGQDNNSVDSPPLLKTHQNPLAAISSSELEEMAKPQTPKCTYYNMSHGSDSDPFFDDSIVKNGRKDTGSARGRDFRVSPTIDTSKTWANKNGSMSSFTSVEFKIPDRKVHPAGESSAMVRARRTSSGVGNSLQAQDSLDTLQMRCSQYCPIL